jgi:uncharacterized membrane protein
MAAPFEGFVIPPLTHSIALLVGTAIIISFLYASRPPITQRIALSFAPWIISGGALHVFYQLGEQLGRQVFPEQVAPLFSAPAVYLATFLGMGTIWTVSAMIVPPDRHDKRVSQYLGATGIGVMIPLVGLVVWQGLDPALEGMEPVEPLLGLIAAFVLTFVVYFVIGAWRTYVIAQARYVGALVIFAHLFDGITTAIGYDLLGAEERSALPQMILEFAGDLPTADVIGSGWLFVLVKLVLASAIVIAFSDYVTDEPTRGNLFFAIVAAVGLGPAAHNFFMFILDIPPEQVVENTDSILPVLTLAIPF